MSNATQFPILNPNTSLAYLPPDIASQLEVYRYIVVSAAAAYGWELLSNSRAHFELLFGGRSRLSATTAAYFVSIFATIVFVVGCVVFHIAPVHSCETFTIVIVTGYSIAIPASSFLFLLRVRAVFKFNPAIQWLFSFLWLGVLGSALTLPFALHGAHIGPTSYCIDSGVRSFGSAGMIASTIFDSLVFLAISWKLTSDWMQGLTVREKAGIFFGGKALPAFSRGLLQSGQIYYLISVCVNIAATVMMMNPSVLPLYHAVLTTPNAALMNAMACRVFRAIKFGDFLEDTTGSLPFSTRPSFLSSPSRSSKGGPQIGALTKSKTGRPLTQIVFTPEPVESFLVDSMSDSASRESDV